ncbi:MAG: hypothetical protein WCG47_24660 [Dermatophilaceae bacterium]
MQQRPVYWAAPGRAGRTGRPNPPEAAISARERTCSPPASVTVKAASSHTASTTRAPVRTGSSNRAANARRYAVISPWVGYRPGSPGNGKPGRAENRAGENNLRLS